MEPRNRFQGMNSAILCSRYDNPIPPRFLPPIDCSKIPAPVSFTTGSRRKLWFTHWSSSKYFKFAITSKGKHPGQKTSPHLNILYITVVLMIIQYLLAWLRTCGKHFWTETGVESLQENSPSATTLSKIVYKLLAYLTGYISFQVTDEHWSFPSNIFMFVLWQFFVRTFFRVRKSHTSV
jgi:hypothetical protein